MEMTDAKVVEKKIYEEGKKHDEYASKGIAGTGLGLGIAGTVLGLGAWLFGSNNRSVFGSLGNGNMPENVNINTYGATTSSNQPTALQVMEKECADEVKLLTDMFGMKLDTANKFYAMRETDVNEKFSLWKSQVDADFGLYKSQIDADFRLYKGQRDAFDALNEKFTSKFCELDKEVAVLKATRPYQDKLLMAYTDQKCCRKIDGQLVLPNTPVVSGYGSYSGCSCVSSGTAAGA